jgi:hypothetical protein
MAQTLDVSLPSTTDARTELYQPRQTLKEALFLLAGDVNRAPVLRRSVTLKAATFHVHKSSLAAGMSLLLLSTRPPTDGLSGTLIMGTVGKSVANIQIWSESGKDIGYCTGR